MRSKAVSEVNHSVTKLFNTISEKQKHLVDTLSEDVQLALKNGTGKRDKNKKRSWLNKKDGFKKPKGGF